MGAVEDAVSTTRQAERETKSRLRIFDCDVHPVPRDGLNKLGMRPAKYIESDACPLSSEPCRTKADEAVSPLPEGKLHPTFTAVYSIDSGTVKVAQFLESLAFTYAK